MEKIEMVKTLYSFFNDADNASAQLAVRRSTLSWITNCPEVGCVIHNAVKSFGWATLPLLHDDIPNPIDGLERLVDFWESVSNHIAKADLPRRTGCLIRIASDLKDIGRHMLTFAVDHRNQAFALAVVSVAQHALTSLKNAHKVYKEDFSVDAYAAVEYCKVLLWHTVWTVIEDVLEYSEYPPSHDSCKIRNKCAELLGIKRPLTSEEEAAWEQALHDVIKDEREVFPYV